MKEYSKYAAVKCFEELKSIVREKGGAIAKPLYADSYFVELENDRFCFNHNGFSFSCIFGSVNERLSSKEYYTLKVTFCKCELNKGENIPFGTDKVILPELKYHLVTYSETGESAWHLGYGHPNSILFTDLVNSLEYRILKAAE